MNHQQWDPVILTKKPKATTVTNTVAKQNINKTSTTITCEKIYDPNNPSAEPEIRPVMIDKEFGKQIVDARCALKLTQKQFAAAICIPANIISEYEKGQGVRNGNYVDKIKKFISKK